MENNNNNNNNNYNYNTVNAYLLNSEEQLKEQPKRQCNEKSEKQEKRTISEMNPDALAFKGIREVAHAHKAVRAAVETLIEFINMKGTKNIEVGDPVFMEMCAFALFESTKEPKLEPARLLYGVFKVLIADYLRERQKKNDKEAK